MLTESRSPGSALSARSAWASASRSMARPSGPASTAGRKAPAERISPFGIRIRASISKKAGLARVPRLHHRLEVEEHPALHQRLRDGEAQPGLGLEPALRHQRLGRHREPAAA